MTEVPVEVEMDARYEQVDYRFENLEKDVNLILDGTDAQAKETEILKTSRLQYHNNLDTRNENYHK